MFWSLFVNFTFFAGLFRINTTYSNVFLMKSWSKNVNHTNFNMQQNKALSGMITYLCITNSSLQEEAEKMAAKKKRVNIKSASSIVIQNSPICQTFFRNT